MDINNTPEPRMPLVENLEFLDLMGVISSPCIICGVRIRRSAGEHRTRLTSANQWRRWRWPPDAMPSRCCEFVDSRLRRSPPDRASAVPYGQAGEKRYAFPPPCPQVGGCPQASQHPATRQDEFDFGGRVKPAAGYRGPLAYSSPEAVQTTGTVAQVERTRTSIRR